MTLLVEGGEPFFFPGNQVGCLLVHGFTGTPNEMRPLGTHLAQRGYSVLGIRLFGHATQEEDLFRVRYRDWLASVEDGFNLLRPNSQQLIAIGLSGGAVLTLQLAASHRVEGVVAMSTPFRLPNDPRLPFARPLSYLWPRFAKPNRKLAPIKGEQPISYPSFPTWAIAEFSDLLSDMRRSLPRVTVPALLLQSRQDASIGVAADAMESIHESLGTRNKRMIWLEGERHVITRDEPRERVFEEVTTFVEEIVAGAAGVNQHDESGTP